MTAQLQIIDYVAKQLQQGVSPEQVRGFLLASKWKEEDINEALIEANKIIEAQKNNPTPKTTSDPLEAAQAEKAKDNSSENNNKIINEEDLGADHSLPSTFEMIAHALKMYKERFQTYFGIMAIQVIATILVVMLSNLESIELSSFWNHLKDLAYTSDMVLSILFMTTIYLINIWGVVALIYSTAQENDVGIIESYKHGWHKILTYYWIILLLTFIISGSLVLLVIPALIFLLWFSQVIFIPVIEDLKGMEALLKSREYVKELWFTVMLRLIIILIIASGIYLEAVDLNKSIWTKLAAISLLTPFVVNYLFALYESLKAEKGEFEFKATIEQKAIFVVSALTGFLLGIAFLLFYISSYSSGQNSQTRVQDLIEIETSLVKYYKKNSKFPNTLDDLVPDYINIVPEDPFFDKPYPYRSLAGGSDYELCIKDITKHDMCINKPKSGEKRSFIIVK